MNKNKENTTIKSIKLISKENSNELKRSKVKEKNATSNTTNSPTSNNSSKCPNPNE